MEKQKQTAKPKETPEQRPALYCVVHENTSGDRCVADGVWLLKGSGKVLIKDSTTTSISGILAPMAPGSFSEGLPEGPKYTGPIDDEMMANILLYG